MLPEERNTSTRYSCLYVISEGRYGRRICNKVILDKIFHLCKEHKHGPLSKI